MVLSFSKTPKARHLLLAGFFAVAIPMVLGFLIFRMNPSACYDSPCALPLLLLTAPPFAAPVLPALFAINRRLERPLPDGWLPTILMAGIVGQIAISSFSVALASPNIREIFLSDILFFPEGLFVGLAMGVVFWVALYALGQNSAQG